MGRTLYDFKGLLDRFTSMNDDDIMREFVMVISELDYIEEYLEEEDYFYYCEPLIEAENYISVYLARKSCFDAGLL